MRTVPTMDVLHRFDVAPFHDTFLSLASAVVVFAGNRIVDCNQAAEEYWLAKNKEALLSKTGFELIYTTKSASAHFLNLLNNCIQANSYKTDVLTQTFNGNIVHGQVSMICWVGNGKEPIVYSIWTAFLSHPVQGSSEKSHQNISSANGLSDLRTGKSVEGIKDKGLPITSIGLTADRYGLVDFDIKNDVIVFEKKICEFLGIFNTNISDNSFVISSKDFINKYIDEPDKQLVKEKLSALNMYSSVNSITRNKIDFALINDLGQIRNTRILFKPILDEGGNLKKYHGVLQDYTEQDYYQDKVNRYKSNLEILIKKRTQQLTRSQANLSDALDFANLSIWEFDAEYKVFKVSGKMFQSTKNYDNKLRDKVLSISDVEELLIEDDWLAFKERLDFLSTEALDGHTEYLEIRTKPSGKISRHYHLNAKCTNDEFNARKIYGTIQDITQIKRTQDENTRLIEMVEASDDIIIVANKEIELEYINAAGKALLDSENRSLFVDFDKKNKYSEILNSIKSGVITAMAVGSWKGETSITRYDGYNVPFSVQVIAHTSSNQIKFISAVFRDLVKQKKTEDDLLKKNKDLDTFLYRTSHDFRAPITTLIGLVKLAKIEVVDQKALQYIGMFEEQFDRLHKLNVNISKLIGINDASVFEGNKTIHNTKSLVDKIIKELSLKHNVSELLFDTESCQIIQYWPKGVEMLSIAIYNLLENAILFRRADILTLVKIKIESVSNYKSLIIEVSDNGMGIPNDISPRIFEMFYRGNEKSKGFGLGLFKVKKIVEKLNGSIQVGTSLGEGSNFLIKLPLIVESI